MSEALGEVDALDNNVDIGDCRSLIDAGWSRYWGTETYFSDYPVLTIKAADQLSRMGLKGIGFDTISVDSANSQDFPIHRINLHKDTLVVENLVNLDRLPGHGFVFSCLPLSLEGADGSPVRAVAYLI